MCVNDGWKVQIEEMKNKLVKDKMTYHRIGQKSSNVIYRVIFIFMYMYLRIMYLIESMTKKNVIYHVIFMYMYLRMMYLIESMTKKCVRIFFGINNM